MKKVSEIILDNSRESSCELPATVDHKCDYCGKIHQTEVCRTSFGKDAPMSPYCEECRELLRTTGEYAKFNRCHRCNKVHLIPDHSGYRHENEYCETCRPIYDAEQAAAARQSRVDSFARKCPPLYQQTDTARLPQAQYTQVMAWQYGATGLLLHGETGKCKTRCAWLRLQKLYIEERRGFVWFDSVSFSHAITKNFSAEGKSEQWLENINDASVLFLDDLGKCRLTERGEAELFGIIENRMANLKPIIATTNFVGMTLAGGLRPDIGSALVRRLRECCEAIAF